MILQCAYKHNQERYNQKWINNCKNDITAQNKIVYVLNFQWYSGYTQ